MGQDELRGLDRPLRREALLEEADVPQDIPGEDEDILEDHGHLRPEPARVELADVPAIDEDPAPLGIIEPEEEVDDRRLPRAGRADEGHSLPRLDPEGDSTEDPFLVLVGEPDILELHLPAKLRPSRKWPPLLLRLIEQVEDLLRRGQRPLHDVIFLREIDQRLEEHPDIRDERHQCPQGEAPADHPAPAIPEEEGHRQGLHQADQWVEDSADEELLHVRIVFGPVDLGELAAAPLLLAEELDDPHPGDRLLEEGIELG